MESKAIGRNLAISKKDAVEIASFIRGKKLKKVKVMLEEVIVKKLIVPFKRFNKDRGHKRGKMAAGRYPVKASTHILGLVKSAEMNALNKGMNSDDLYISRIIANKGTGQMHHGRFRGRSMKRTHLEVALSEVKKNKK
tara:strand:+ start:1106 stop:1519 length:414 start_codon:yes stop_codon:yes gene_type:complete